MSTRESYLETPQSEPVSALEAFAARRAPRISQTDVFRAADELLLAGHRPTIDRVRMKLGRGSPNTINDHLDAWWPKLGARLRDLPGQELPHLPESIAQRLQQLWHEALDTARGVLQETLAQRESDLAAREQTFAERERAANERVTALEEGLTLARQQLTAANERAAALEAGSDRLNEQIDRWQAEARQAQAKTEAAVASHATERAELLSRSALTEQHWMRELDQARQGLRESNQRHEKELNEGRRQLLALKAERDDRSQQVAALRADSQAHTAVREQLEAQLRTLMNRSGPAKAIVASSRQGTARTASAKRAPKHSRRKSPRS